MPTNQQELEQLVNRTVALYNRLRSPEVTVKAVSVSLQSVAVSFSGGFCYGCGVMDYIDGFIQQFKLLSRGNLELKAGKTTEVNPRTFEANFTVKTKSG